MARARHIHNCLENAQLPAHATSRARKASRARKPSARAACRAQVARAGSCAREMLRAREVARARRCARGKVLISTLADFHWTDLNLATEKVPPTSFLVTTVKLPATPSARAAPAPPRPRRPARNGAHEIRARAFCGARTCSRAHICGIARRAHAQTVRHTVGQIQTNQMH